GRVGPIRVGCTCVAIWQWRQTIPCLRRWPDEVPCLPVHSVTSPHYMPLCPFWLYLSYQRAHLACASHGPRPCWYSLLVELAGRAVWRLLENAVETCRSRRGSGRPGRCEAVNRDADDVPIGRPSALVHHFIVLPAALIGGGDEGARD